MVNTYVNYVSAGLPAVTPRQEIRPKWTPRRTLLFVVGSSAGLWTGLIAAVTALTS